MFSSHPAPSGDSSRSPRSWRCCPSWNFLTLSAHNLPWFSQSFLVLALKVLSLGPSRWSSLRTVSAISLRREHKALPESSSLGWASFLVSEAFSLPLLFYSGAKWRIGGGSEEYGEVVLFITWSSFPHSTPLHSPVPP